MNDHSAPASLRDRGALGATVRDALERLRLAAGALPSDGPFTPRVASFPITDPDLPLARVDLTVGRAPSVPGAAGPARCYLDVRVVTAGEGTASSQFVALAPTAELVARLAEPTALVDAVLTSLDAACASMRRHGLR
ncbi:MAG: hypothetical protein HY909_28285 [Deltaproteobacteria bacterium]|nr:hypothetical protein [Deltaproteobacteria bacterium]